MRTIYPQPGHTEQELRDLLASKQFVHVDCFTISPKVGDPLRYTSGQRTVEVEPWDAPGTLEQYKSSAVKVSGLAMRAGIGVEVDEQSLAMDYGPSDRYYGLSYAQAIKLGRFDGATVRRDRYFAANWEVRGRQPDWVAGIPMFEGRFSTVDRVGRSHAEFKVKSALILLNMRMPRKSYQAQCNHTFGDPGCGIDRTLFEVAATVGAGSDAMTLYTPLAAASHKMGTVHVEDINNVTSIRTIKEVVAGSHVLLAYPLDFAPLEGEQFKMYPGCARTYTGENSCETYDNQAQYQGFPFVPVAETAF